MNDTSTAFIMIFMNQFFSISARLKSNIVTVLMLANTY